MITLVAQFMSALQPITRIILLCSLAMMSPSVARGLITVPQISERHMLTYEGSSLFDGFGHAVDINDGIAVISVGGRRLSGELFNEVLIYEPITGNRLHTLVSPLNVTPSSLGSSVAVDSNLVVAGDIFAMTQGVINSGVAHVYNAETGSFVRNLLDNNPSHNSFYGGHVAISGQDILVGARRRGPVYFDASTGNVQPTLVSPDPRFTLGSSFDVDEGRALITGTDSSGVAAGIVIDLATRQLISVLQPTGEDVTGFRRVAIDGDRAILGAPGASNFDGAAFIFDVNSGQQIHRISSPVTRTGNTTRDAFFGTDVDIDGHLAIVGFPNNDARGHLAGSAYVYHTETGNLVAELVPTDIRNGDWFGIEVSIDDGLALVGATRNQAGATHGAAYVFVVPEPSTVPLVAVALLALGFQLRTSLRHKRFV